MSDIYCYQGYTFDFWEGWLPIECLPKFVSRRSEDDGAAFVGSTWQQRVNDLFRRGKYLAERIGWDHTIGDGPYVTFTFDLQLAFDSYATEGIGLVLAWKESHDGTTYVVSETPLPFSNKEGNIQNGVKEDVEA